MESSMTDSDDDHPFCRKDSHVFMTETAWTTNKSSASRLL